MFILFVNWIERIVLHACMYIKLKSIDMAMGCEQASLTLFLCSTGPNHQGEHEQC
jgi:hypothetical protein